MTGGLIAFYSIVYGAVMSLISFVISLVVAAIAGTKNMKSIWGWGICFQMAAENRAGVLGRGLLGTVRAFWVSASFQSGR